LDLAKTRQAAGERPTRGSQMTQGDRNAMLIRWASSRGWRDDEPLSDFVRREQRREREQTT
jgi:hypothetical protein